MEKKEAMKILKDFHDKSALFSIRTALDTIIPELKDRKESESEKIKKQIIGFITYSKTLDETKKNWIAWLEKQGEQKPAKWHREDEQNLNVCLGYIQDEFLRRWLTDIIHVKYDKPVDNVESKHICELDNSYARVKFPFKAKVKSTGIVVTIHSGQSSGHEWIKYQSDKEDGYKVYKPGDLELVCDVEPNPAWCEDDETIKNNISHIISQYDKISKKENQPCWYVGDCLLWMQNIKERVQPQPKQECGEEDRKIIIELIGIFESAVDGGHVSFPYRLIKDYIRVLKSCLPQNT